ncbi:hypothetical protein A9W98_17865 [Mycobacterium gordonae]|uniref:Uncharacterized protein n=1 Tax=Mycobacterium gordonae TaxID=1778 RepID=A0A1A6BHM4_MYCGO|nr:hypothetical protein [Mycobacterium gordonae]OBS01852.1 hypothetical protein A9W98_17865 [Mycobacterium gordonae]
MLVVGAGIAMLAATAGLLTGMNTVLKVGAVITIVCLAATAGINFRFERQRARREREHPADCLCTFWSVHYVRQVCAR